MFRQRCRVEGSCSSGPIVARTVGTKSTGGCNRPEWSPCTYLDEFHPHLAHGELRLVALVQDLLVFDLELDVLVVSHAAADAVEDVEVRGDRQVTI